jgi:hypothetical protein
MFEPLDEPPLPSNRRCTLENPKIDESRLMDTCSYVLAVAGRPPDVKRCGKVIPPSFENRTIRLSAG